jgi:hypothetical protein
LGGGVAGLAQIGFTDLAAGVVGAAGYAFNLGANAVNVLSLGNLRSNGSILAALGTFVGNTIVPDYGVFGGPNWGVSVVGANPQYALNSALLWDNPLRCTGELLPSNMGDGVITTYALRMELTVVASTPLIFAIMLRCR